MREIKFRIYHSLYGMSQPFGLDWGEIEFQAPLDDGMAAIFKPADQQTRLMFEQSRKMQFTGHSDKNGKKIYEDDYVWIGTHYDGDNTHREYIGRVVFSGDGWWVQGPYDRGDSLAGSTDNGVEVVGNAYQNPEMEPPQHGPWMICPNRSCEKANKCFAGKPHRHDDGCTTYLDHCPKCVNYEWPKVTRRVLGSVRKEEE